MQKVEREGGAPGELRAAERLTGRGVVVLAEPRRAHELKRQAPQSLRLLREPQPLESANEEPVDIDPDGAPPVAAWVEVGARLRHRGYGPRCLPRRPVAGGRPKRFVEESGRPALVGGGLAVLFRCPWWAILSSIVVGASVGLVTTHLNRRSATASIVPFVSAFASTTVVGVLAELFGFGHVPLYAVCAPVAILVPGALITNALLELTAQDVVTGSARLSFGLIQLGFMIAGIAAGASITGLALDPGSAALVGQVARVSATNPGWQAIPPLWFSWIGVAILAAGVGLAFGSGRKLILVSVAVMTCTYAVLITLTPITGSTFATGATAAVLFIGASALEQFLLAVPAPVSFQPAFLLLVPGTVGLVALTTFDTDALLSALKTFASLCIGIKVGAMLAEIALPSAGKNR